MLTESGPKRSDPRPLVVHVLHRFATGGLENGVVKLIENLPAARYRHGVLAVDTIDPTFASRVTRGDVQFLALHKPPGHAFRLYPRILAQLRAWRPAIVHTRNLAALELQPLAALARVPVRIHGEHGRDVDDLDGSSRRHQRIRRLYSPFVQRYVALSRDLEQYLVQRVGIDARRITQIYNGVDAQRFAPAGSGAAPAGDAPFAAPAHFVFGTVGRMQAVKHQTLLARAFVRALDLAPELRGRARLALIGDGPLRAECQALLDAAGLAALAWLPGERSDIPALMRGFDAFVLPSLAEGISNTILEAMASGLPVVATAVGGNAELVDEGRAGLLVPSDDVEAMAQAMVRLARDPAAAASMGRAGRAAVEQRFSLQAMVGAYQQLYDDALQSAGWPRP